MKTYFEMTPSEKLQHIRQELQTLELLYDAGMKSAEEVLQLLALFEDVKASAGLDLSRQKLAN